MAEVVHLHTQKPAAPVPPARRLRAVPVGFCLKALFGGGLTQLGWLLVTLGFLLTYAITQNNAYTDLFRFRHVRLAPGVITGIHRTGNRRFRSSRMERPFTASRTVFNPLARQ